MSKLRSLIDGVDQGRAFLPSRLPEAWSATRLKNILTRNDSGAWGEESEENEGTTVLRSTDMTEEGKWRLVEPAVRKLSATEGSKTRLSEGDLIVTKSSGSPRHLGKVALVTEEVEATNCSFSNFMQRLRLRGDHHPRFWFHFLNSYPGRQQLLFSGSTTTGLANLSASILGNLVVPVPPVSQQRAIADFLDRETAKIDHLIEQKERLIEILQEKRTALITRAVTKGLDPHVEMKDSGVEWLGEIPVNWEVSPVKFVSSFVTSGSRGWSQYYADNGPTFVRIGNLAAGSIDLDMSQKQAVEPPVGKEAERSRVRPGDLLISITALIGAVGVVPEGLGEAYVNQHVALVRLRDLVNPRWVAYCLLSRVGQVQFDRELYGGTKDGLSLDDVREARLLLPPIETQAALVTYLDEQLERLSEVVDTIKQAITLLREYRTALISAAVTGKIDVREHTHE